MCCTGLVGTISCLSSKTDFVEEQDSLNSTEVSDGDDVEVKHTIVVSTKLKNNNHRGIIDGKNIISNVLLSCTKCSFFIYNDLVSLYLW